MGKIAGSLIVDIGMNVARLQKDIAENTRTITKFTNSTQNSFRQMQSVVEGALSFYAIRRFTTSTIDAAEKMQNSMRGLAGVARYAGEDIGVSIQAAAVLAEDGLIDVASASKALQNLLQRGFSLEESIAMLNRLKDAAAFNRQGHLSMAQAVQSATEGLKNENSILVDNAGVTKNVSQMWKEYAGEIGKGVMGLSQAEKRQAEYNGIMRETEAQVGNAKLAVEGITGAKARLTNEVFMLNAAIGESLIPAFIEITKFARWTMDQGIKPMIGGLEILSTKAAGAAERISLSLAMSMTREPAIIKDLMRQLDDVDVKVESQIQEIMKHWSGVLQIPEIGKDTGNRRKDIVSLAAGAVGGGSNAAADKLRKADDAIAKWWLDLIEKQEQEAKKIAIEMAQFQVDQGSWVLEQKRQSLDEWIKYEGEKAEEVVEFWKGVAQRRVEIESEMWKSIMDVNNLIGGEAGRGMGLLAGAGKDYFSEQAGTDAYSQRLVQIQEYYDNAMQLYQDGNMGLLEMSERTGTAIAEIDLVTNQKRLSSYTMYAQAIQGVAATMGAMLEGKSKALFIMERAAMVAMAIISAHASAAAALAPPPLGLGPVAGAPLAASMLTFGYAQAAIIAATGMMQMASGGKGTATPSGGYAYTNPTEPSWQPEPTVTQRQQSINFYIYGNVYDEKKLARELQPYLTQAYGDGVR